MDLSDDPVLSRYFSTLVAVPPAAAGRSPRDKPVQRRDPNRCSAVVVGTTIRGRRYRHKEQEVQLYPIGQLAAVLHRRSVTLRRWEQLGYLPRPRLRLPVGHGKYHSRRLYTEEFIRIAAAAAVKSGLLLDEYPAAGLEEFGRLVRRHLRPNVPNESP